MVHIEAINKTISAKGLAAVYTDRVFRYHGVPQSIVSDRDPRFTILFWCELASRLGTKLHMSTAYHPQTDGQTEHVNGVLEDTLRHLLGPSVKNFRLQSGLCRKLAPRFVGPFRVIEAVRSAKLAFKLELPKDLRIM